MNLAGMEEAEAKLRALLRDDPANVFAIHDLGVLAHRDGRKREACHLLKQATRLEPHNVALLKSFGQVLRETGDPAAAALVFQQTLDIEPRDAAVWNALGVCLQESAQPAQAIEAYLRALMFDPDLAEVFNNMGIVLLHEKDAAGAIDNFEQAIAIKEDYAEAHSNLALAYRDRLDYIRATKHFRRAAALKPENSNTAAGLGEILSLVYDPESEMVLQQAVRLDPQSAERHWNLALDMLRRGDYRNGWREHEWRWQRGHGHNLPRDFPQPYWLGEDIADKTLLLHAEQGFGDTLQMLRYLPMVLQRTNHVILEVQPELHRLVADYFAAQYTDVAVVAHGNPLPVFDTHIAMMSLPLVFATTIANIPPPLRLTPSVGSRTPGTSLRVGLAWAGNSAHSRDRERSLTLAMLRPLFDVQGCSWVSLQTGDATKQIAAMEISGIPIEQPLLRDFADTAVVLDTLDIVFSVDSAVAHLAASQGVATGILLPYVADWRWLQPDCVINPWYPNARIFRQKNFPYETEQQLRWEPVVKCLVDTLKEIHQRKQKLDDVTMLES